MASTTTACDRHRIQRLPVNEERMKSDCSTMSISQRRGAAKPVPISVDSNQIPMVFGPAGDEEEFLCHT